MTLHPIRSLAPLRLVRSLLLALSLVLVAASASAGTVQIKDTASLLAAGDAAALRSDGARLPFDVRVVTSTAYADASSFDAFVHAQMAEPNMVVIGIDPSHRRTSVHVGTATGIDPAQARAIEAAAAPHFKSGDFRGGIDAMFAAARAAVGTAPSRGRGEVAPAGGASHAGTWLFGFLAIVAVVGIGVAIAAAAARRNAAGGYGPGAGYGAAPPGGYPGGYPPGYGPPGPGPGYGFGAPRSGLGTGLAGAAVGGLVGYELGKMAGGHETHRGHDDGDRAGMWNGGDGGGPADYDAGGSTSSWDDSGGGSDWGGGDSGGGDFGGGDSGGGSDW